jgi:hypothetical protein
VNQHVVINLIFRKLTRYEKDETGVYI